MKKPLPQKTPTIDFDLRQLEIFSKVVELGSFSRAAEVVFLAQASVSERVATLENIVGTKLLDRLGRQIVPTKAGELLYKNALRLLEMKRAASLEMQGFLGLESGAVYMGGSTIPGEYILPEVIKLFREKHPLMTVCLTIGDSRQIEKEVLDGNLELGVIGSKNVHRSLIRNELWEDELVLVVPASHRWAKKSAISLEELVDEPFILREAGSGTLNIMGDYLRESGLKGIKSLEIAARFSTSTAVKEGIKTGLGVSILSLRALRTELDTGILKALKIKGLAMSRKFHLIRDRRRTASPLCQAMAEFLLATKK
ncbi:LysR substrate binding domain protein [uncultured Desulfobacterium sp.]|uniref:LysR substrate binding domain protein n=1 Tax=uncultured Desulfobacterium sp. TaxID=201089 RepID=A0A445MUD8_9BACT|nr:LysR substrate binding domain protein [uncultured Desulfobacterium sp.]